MRPFPPRLFSFPLRFHLSFPLISRFFFSCPFFPVRSLCRPFPFSPYALFLLCSRSSFCSLSFTVLFFARFSSACFLSSACSSSSACSLSSVLHANAAKTHPFFFPFPPWETKLRIRFRAQRRSVYSAPLLKKPSVSSTETDGVVDQIFSKIKLRGLIFSFYRALPKLRRPSSLPLLFSSTSCRLSRPRRLPVFRPKASPAEG